MATGFFGKMPTAGDFVARNLPPGARAPLDRWLTRWLAAKAEWPGHWPPRGLRGVVDFGVGPTAVLILPSEDGAGRAFPLAVLVPGEGAGQATVDAWADEALYPLDEAAAGEVTTAELARLLEEIDDPVEGPAVAVSSLWSEGRGPAPVEEALAAMFEATG